MNQTKLNIQIVHSEKEYLAAANLFREYAHWLGIDLSFQGFEAELADIKSMYAPPLGQIWLAIYQDKAVGCIALRPKNEMTGELKRMYVQPEFQRKGIGQQLLDTAVSYAIEQGKESLLLDTLNHMEPAMKLYLKNGFEEIPAYYHNPYQEAVYFKKWLK
jgi:putative acetyltransferase